MKNMIFNWLNIILRSVLGQYETVKTDYLKGGADDGSK